MPLPIPVRQTSLSSPTGTVGRRTPFRIRCRLSVVFLSKRRLGVCVGVSLEVVRHRLVVFSSAVARVCAQEVEKALEHGASVIMVNNWDRITGKLYPKQAMAVRHLIPDQASITR